MKNGFNQTRTVDIGWDLNRKKNSTVLRCQEYIKYLHVDSCEIYESYKYKGYNMPHIAFFYAFLNYFHPSCNMHRSWRSTSYELGQTLSMLPETKNFFITYEDIWNKGLHNKDKY
jgi:hypothetical protein